MKLMFNEDWMHFIWSRFSFDIDVTEEVIKEFIYQYKGTQITDFAMNVNGTVSTVPSKIRQDFCDKYLATEENGIKVDYKNTHAKKAYEIFEEKKLDMYRIWIDTLNEIGINPWISVRVNDVHGNENETDVRKSEQVDGRPDIWRIRHREANGYYDKCQDFELEKVRNEFLGYIEEIFERYSGIYGLELDFSRQAYLFAPSREKAGIEIANNLMKDIRVLCDKYAVKNINVLVPAKYQTCLDYGLDPVKWAESGCADSVVAISHWQSINTDYQIDLWKKLLDGAAKFGTGQQMNVRAYPNAQSVVTSVEMAYGQASANLYNGSDFVYLYNYMDLLENGDVKGSGLYPSSIYPGCIRQTEIQYEMFKSLGDYESMSKHRRSHVLTYDDYNSYWDSISCRLPAEFDGGEAYAAFKIMTGGMSETETAELRLGLDKKIGAEDVEVYVNRKKAQFKCYGEIHPKLNQLVGHIFEITNKPAGYAIVEIKIKVPATLDYADITITP